MSPTNINWNINLATNRHWLAQSFEKDDPHTIESTKTSGYESEDEAALIEELELRSKPICEIWESRGPGLLHSLHKLTGIDGLPNEIVVEPVQPIFGGGGTIIPDQNKVVIEAILANPFPSLPEVVRLGWLIARLVCRQDKLDGEYLALAVLPAVLQAAEEVELARCDEPSIRLALEKWRVVDFDHENLSHALQSWWSEFKSERPAWPNAVAALGRKLG